MTRSKDGKQPYCRRCATEAHRDWRSRNPEKAKAARERQSIVSRRNYSRFSRARSRGIKITREEFELAVQQTFCDICRKTIVPGTRGHHLDHDHTTGQFRGVLCHGCNTSLGHLKDDPEVLRSAIRYLSEALDRYDPTTVYEPPLGRTGRKKVSPDDD